MVENAALAPIEKPRVLDVCSGTGDVLLAFAHRYPVGTFIGCDFSLGMLVAAGRKDFADRVTFIQGNAARLPFADNTFHAVSCSHALYELKGEDRARALQEMKRVIRKDGVVLIMEHEVPTRPLAVFMFRLRLKAMGAVDTKAFVECGLEPFQKVFGSVTLHHTPSERSRLICCRK